MAPYASSSSPHPPIPPAVNLPKPQPFEFGESVFLKRRAEWLALPAPSSSSSRSPPGGKNDSAKRLKPLKTLMDEVGDGEVPEAVWKGALSDVHRGLLGGRRLAKPMPLSLTIKILKAGWLRDGTWPKNLPPVPDSPPFGATPASADDPLNGAASEDVSVMLGSPKRLQEMEDGQERLVKEGSGSVGDTEGPLGA